MNSGFSDLWRLLAEYQVRFLVIGGYAVIRYTEPRYTKDLDLWIEPTASNQPPRTRSGVTERSRLLGAPLTGLSPLDFTQQGYIIKWVSHRHGSKS